MDNLKEFRDAARQYGFVDVEDTDDGTVLWLRKATAIAEDRMCIDSAANTVTVFWATLPWKINSKTFRAVSALQEWLAATSEPAAAAPATMSNREALLRLAADKDDAPALTWLCEHNAEVVHAAMSRYFGAGPVSEKAQPMVMQRVADHARTYETGDDADQWLAQCVQSECDRLRNETIQEKANKD
jgi:hypothetical protein